MQYLLVGVAAEDSLSSPAVVVVATITLVGVASIPAESKSECSHSTRSHRS
jgi:hypothetical protein